MTDRLHRRDPVNHFIRLAENGGYFDDWEMGLTEENLSEGLREYTPEFLVQLADLLQQHTKNTIGGILIGLHNATALEVLLDSLHFHNLLGGDDYYQSLALMKSLPTYGELIDQRDDYRNASAAQVQQYLGLMRFVRHFQGRTVNGGLFAECPEKLLYKGDLSIGYSCIYAIDDRNLVRLIVDYPERTEDIARIIESREIFDPEMILGILETNAPAALGEGAL